MISKKQIKEELEKWNESERERINKYRQKYTFSQLGLEGHIEIILMEYKRYVNDICNNEKTLEKSNLQKGELFTIMQKKTNELLGKWFNSERKRIE